MSYRVQFTISDEQKIKLEEDMRRTVILIYQSYVRLERVVIARMHHYTNN